ncbi:transposase [candidate division KSB1 bacterium]|nr:transposase [candidate division KSB1 bacterium]
MQCKGSFNRDWQSRFSQAVAAPEQAGARLFSYLDFPKQHWRSIKSANVIASIFAIVKLRTDARR